MKVHKTFPAGGTSAPRAERQALQPPAPAPRTSQTGDEARADLPVHDLSRMSIGPQPGRGEPPADPRRRSGASANNTGLPARLKAGVENLSGLAMDDVKVHFNSPKPAALQALAYTQGTDIHVGPGQERHLPHEAWHVAQQKQGRVKPTLQMKGKAINHDGALEREADAMGARANSQAATRTGVARDERKPAAPMRPGRIFQFTDDDAKAYIAEQHIEDKHLNVEVSYENVRLYCFNKNNQKDKKVGLAKAWNKNRTDKQYIDTPSIIYDKNISAAPADTTTAVSSTTTDDEKQNTSNNQSTTTTTSSASTTNNNTVVSNNASATNINAVTTSNNTASTTASSTQGGGWTTIAAAPIKAPKAPLQRSTELDNEAERLIAEIAKHYTANQGGAPSFRNMRSVIKTTITERQAIRSYLSTNYHNKPVTGFNDIKYYVVGGTGDKIDITGHRHSGGKDKSKGSGTNKFNYHIDWM